MNLKKVHHIAIIGSNYEKSRRFYVDLLGFLEKGKINAKVMVTDIFGLNEIDEAMSAKKPDRVSIKTVLVP